MHGNERLGEETRKLFNLFLEKTGGTDPANFRAVCMEDILALEGIVQADIYLYDVVVLDGSTIGELVRTSIAKHFNTLGLVRCDIHICHVSNINALFKDYRFQSCDKFIK